MRTTYNHPKAWLFLLLICMASYLNAQIAVIPTVTHMDCGQSNAGSISLSVSGGTSPYTYKWSNAATTSAIGGLAASIYTATVYDNGGDSLVRSMALGYKTTWDELVKYEEDGLGGGIVAVHPNGLNDNYAFGLNALPPNTNGWLEFSVAAGDTAQGFLGLADNMNRDQTSQGYGFYIYGSYVLMQSYATPGSPMLGTYTKGNSYRFRIQVTGDSISYIQMKGSGTVLAKQTFPYLGKGGSAGILGMVHGNRMAATYSSFDCSTIRITFNTAPVKDVHTAGSIAANVRGGISPYSYLWSNAATTKDLNNTGVGDYTLVVTDDNSATASRTAFLGAYVTWDTLINITENPDRSLVSTAGSVPTGYYPDAYGTGLNTIPEDTMGILLFEFDRAAQFAGIVGWVATDTNAGLPVGVGLVVLPNAMEDYEDDGLYFLQPYDDPAFLGNITDSVPLSLKFYKDGDSLKVVKNGVVTMSFYYEFHGPASPMVTPFFTGAKVTRATCSFVTSRPLPPTIPDGPRSVCTTDTVHTFVLDSIKAGSGGDKIIWSYSSTFSPRDTIDDYDSLHVAVDAGERDTLWLRSLDSGTGLYSKPVQTILVVNAIPAAPVAPAAQSVCSDTIGLFTLPDSLTSADSLDWSYSKTFEDFFTIRSSDPLIAANFSGMTDTIYMRSRNGLGCVSDAVTTTITHLSKPYKPNTPSPQAFASDTPIVVSFNNIRCSQCNQIQWSLDSLFSSANIDSPDCNISFSLNPGTSSLVFIKAIDTISGCESSITTSIAIVHEGSEQEPGFDTLLQVCKGATTDVIVPSASPYLFYQLKINGIVADTAYGTVAPFYLTTHPIDSSVVYSIIAIDTATSDTSILDSAIYIGCVSPVENPVFVEPDTVIFSSDTLSYRAIANYSTRIEYHIISGGARIDSISGKIDSAWANFVIRATAYGLPGCDTAYTDQFIRITTISEPEARDTLVIADSLGIITISFDTIYAPIGANRIQYSHTPDFATTYTVTSPAVISVTLEPWSDTTIYIRSYNTATREISSTRELRAEVYLRVFDQSLLDKSQWKIEWNDEFNYPFKFPAKNNFYLPDNRYNCLNRWALNYIWDDGGNPSSCINHRIWGDQPENMEMYNLGNYDGSQEDGNAGEVTFDKGVATLKATRVPTHLVSCAHGGNLYIQDISYRSGCISSKNMIDFSTPGLIEMRFRRPNVHKAFPAFWVWTQATEIDFFDDVVEHDALSTIRVINNKYLGEDNGRSCDMDIYKFSPCGFSEDWITYSCMFSPTKMIFFINGRAIWTLRVDQTNLDITNVPRNLDFQGRMFINLAVKPEMWPTFEAKYDIDYFRYYKPVSTNNTTPPQCLHYENVASETALSLQIANRSAYPDGLTKAADKLNVTNSPFLQPRMVHGSRCLNVIKTNAMYSGYNVRAFYKNSYNQVYLMYPVTNTSVGASNENWIQQPIVTTAYGAVSPFFVYDVKDYLTVANERLLYYQTTNNTLGFIKTTNGAWTEGAWTATVSNGNYGIVRDCAGRISIDAIGRVTYRGFDNNLWCWNPGDRNLSKVTTDNQVKGGVVMAKCGCLTFYRDDNNNLIQQSWWNGVWTKLVVVSNHNVTDHLALDEENGRIYFIGQDNGVYYYSYDYNAVNGQGIKRLGNNAVYDTRNNKYLCNDNSNAASGLKISPDKKLIYYIGIDGKLYHYFNDKENSYSPWEGSYAISKENWYMASFPELSGVGDYALSPTIGGELFYVKGKTLYAREWRDAHNPLFCNITELRPNGQSDADTHIQTAYYKTDELTENADTSQDTRLLVYPNPSRDIFTFKLFDNLELANFSLTIYNIQGSQVFASNSQVSISTSKGYSTNWNSNGQASGVYFYQIKCNDRIYTGKIFKY